MIRIEEPYTTKSSGGVIIKQLVIIHLKTKISNISCPIHAIKLKREIV